MSTELQNTNYSLPAPAVADDDALFTGSGKTFLSYVKLYQSSSREVQDELIKAGNFGFVSATDKTEINDLGARFEALAITYRSCGLNQFTGPKGDKSQMYFDMNSDEFKEIIEKSEEKDSGCMWGPQFLFWVPAVQGFAAFWCIGTTAKNEAINIRKLLKHGNQLVPCPIIMQSKLIEQKMGKQVRSWYGPRVVRLSTPLQMPDQELFNTTVNEFCNPVPVEVVPEVTEESDDRVV